MPGRKPARKFGNINVEAACSYLAQVQLDRLDAVAQAVDEAMEDLKLQPDKRAAKLRQTSGAERPTGNIRSILQYLENIPEDAATDEDKKAVQALQAVISERLGGAKYKAKKAKDEEGKPNRIRKKKERVGPRERRRRREIANPQPGGETAEGKKKRRKKKEK